MTENGQNEFFQRLADERDTAMRLAEQAEQRLQEVQQEAEKLMQEGYEEALQILQAERTKREAAEAENADLKALNARLLVANNIDKSLADSLVAELEKEKSAIFQDYDDRLRREKENIVSKLDEFLKTKYAEIDAHIAREKVKELMDKGGKELIKEVLGDEGVKIVEDIEKEDRAEKERATARTKEAEKIRAATRKKILLGGGGYANPMALGKAFGGKSGHPYYNTRNLEDILRETGQLATIEQRVKEMVDHIHKTTEDTSGK